MTETNQRVREIVRSLQAQANGDPAVQFISVAVRDKLLRERNKQIRKDALSVVVVDVAADTRQLELFSNSNNDNTQSADRNSV